MQLVVNLLHFVEKKFLTSEFVCITLYIIYITILEIYMATLSAAVNLFAKKSCEHARNSV